MKTLITLGLVLIPGLATATPPTLTWAEVTRPTVAVRTTPTEAEVTAAAVAHDRATMPHPQPHRVTAAERAAARREQLAERRAREAAAREDARFHGGIPRTINDVSTARRSSSWSGSGSGTFDSSGTATINVTMHPVVHDLDLSRVRIDTHRAMAASLRPPVESRGYVSR